MYTQRLGLAYQAASAEGTTQIGLHILVYDEVVRTLYQAGDAVDQSDIARRCDASNKVLSLVAHLESWTELLKNDDVANSLNTFYAYLRYEVLSLQKSIVRTGFDDLASLVFSLRETWQTKQSQLEAEMAANTPATASQQPGVLMQTTSSANWHV